VPIRSLLRDGYFTPEDVTLLVAAFENVLRDLRLVDRKDPAVTLVAKRIVERARQGQRDPELLREATLKSLSSDPDVSGL
jgi:tRNA C32,U32 (ribose-2'-O)-methylase TrmJ